MPRLGAEFCRAVQYGRSKHAIPPVGGYRPRVVAPLARGGVAVYTPGGRRTVLSEVRAPKYM